MHAQSSISHPRRNLSILLPFIMLFHYFFHLILVFSLHCQLFLRISGSTKICNIKIMSQRKILIVPEEGWFGLPKYSTYIKTILRLPVSASIFFLLSVHSRTILKYARFVRGEIQWHYGVCMTSQKNILA